jgi:predicted dehydrogenase
VKGEKLKVGVVGVGYLGKFHVDKYLSMDDVELVGLSDIDPKVIERAEKDYGVACYNDYHKLIGNVDAVSIVVPTYLHYSVAMDFLDVGSDVFVEKPITSEVAQAEKLVDKAESKELILQVGHLERFNPAILALGGTLKEPMFIESHRLSPFPERSTDVDVVLDLMIHDIDIILNIVKSDIVNIDAVGAPIITQKADIVNARINFESGCVANITASRVSTDKMRKIRIFQSDAYISIDYAAQNITVYKKVRGEDNRVTIIKEDMEISPSDYLGDEIRSFINSVKHRTTPPVTGRDGKRALEVAMRVNESLEKSLKRLREMGILEDGFGT